MERIIKVLLVVIMTMVLLSDGGSANGKSTESTWEPVKVPSDGQQLKVDTSWRGMDILDGIDIYVLTRDLFHNINAFQNDGPMEFDVDHLYTKRKAAENAKRAYKLTFIPVMVRFNIIITHHPETSYITSVFGYDGLASHPMWAFYPERDDPAGKLIMDKETWEECSIIITAAYESVGVYKVSSSSKEE